MNAEFFNFSPRRTEVFWSAWKILPEPFLKPIGDLYFYVLPHLLNRNPRIHVTSAVLVRALSTKSSLVSVLLRLNLRISQRIFSPGWWQVVIRRRGEQGLIIAEVLGRNHQGRYGLQLGMMRPNQPSMFPLGNILPRKLEPNCICSIFRKLFFSVQDFSALRKLKRIFIYLCYLIFLIFKFQPFNLYFQPV